eukprot:SAG11_NODE_3396_length_2471_cov_6.897555_3_plen_202_part_00
MRQNRAMYHRIAGVKSVMKRSHWEDEYAKHQAHMRNACNMPVVLQGHIDHDYGGYDTIEDRRYSGGGNNEGERGLRSKLPQFGRRSRQQHDYNDGCARPLMIWTFSPLRTALLSPAPLSRSFAPSLPSPPPLLPSPPFPHSLTPVSCILSYTHGIVSWVLCLSIADFYDDDSSMHEDVGVSDYEYRASLRAKIALHHRHNC